MTDETQIGILVEYHIRDVVDHLSGSSFPIEPTLGLITINTNELPVLGLATIHFRIDEIIRGGHYGFGKATQNLLKSNSMKRRKLLIRWNITARGIDMEITENDRAALPQILGLMIRRGCSDRFLAYYE